MTSIFPSVWLGQDGFFHLPIISIDFSRTPIFFHTNNTNILEPSRIKWKNQLTIDKYHAKAGQVEVLETSPLSYI